MHFRILLLGLGFLIGYNGRNWLRNSGAGVLSPLTTAAALLVGLAVVFLAWTLGEVLAWAVFWGRNPLLLLSLDALLIGVAVGVVFADQQPAVEQRSKRQAGVPTRAPGAAAKRQGAPQRFAEALQSMSEAWKNLGSGLTIVALLVLAVAQPSYWEHAFHRLKNIEVGGFGIELGPAAGQGVTETIQASAPPEPIGQQRERDRHGFTQPRLDRLQTLTHPPDVPFRPDGVRERLASNPSGFLGIASVKRLGSGDGGAEEARSGGGGRDPPRALTNSVLSDRALLMHLLSGADAVDTSKAGADTAPSARSVDSRDRLWDLAATQERVLSLLAPHVACVREYVALTHDRRLLEYETLGVVEHLYRFTRIWSSLERKMALRHLRAEQSPEGAFEGSFEEAYGELKRQADALTGKLNMFGNQTRHRINAWNVGRETPPPAAEPLRAPVSQGVGDSGHRFAGISTVAMAAAGRDQPTQPPGAGSCSEGTATLAEFVTGRGGTAGNVSRLFEKGGFTPYLTIFMAQILSAMEDHPAALRLLIEWQSDLEELRRAAAERPRSTRRPTPPLYERDAFLAVSTYHRLSAFIDMVILQQLSENASLALPPTEEGLRHLIEELYPDVFLLIRQDVHLKEWRAGHTDHCGRETHSWRQNLVLSYASWLKAYLDLRNQKLVKPEYVEKQDLEYATLLGELNLTCFSKELDTTVKRAEQRAHFAVSSAAVRLNRLVQRGTPVRLRQTEQASLEAALRSSVESLERTRKPKRGAEPGHNLHDLVFGQEDQLLSSAKRLKARLDQLRSLNID